MKEIKLIALHLENFKGVANADYKFGDSAEVRGANGTGKSTIFEAYLWAIFNKNPYGGMPQVQPLDLHNQPKHNLVTEVTAYITVDGMNMAITHKQEEDWSKTRGSGTMVLKGTKHTRLINGVPMAEKDFVEKLNSIANLDDWFMLSSINIIPGMNQDDRRRRLQSIAPEFNERELAAEFPAILQAMNEGKTVAELKTQVRSEMSKAKAALDVIPARIDEQERGRAAAEIDDLMTEEQIQAEIEKLNQNEAQVRAGFRIESSMELRAELASVMATIDGEERCIETEFRNAKSVLEEDTSRLSIVIGSDERRVNMIENDLVSLKARVTAKQTEITNLRAKWETEQASQFDTPDVATVCPTCGQPIPELKIEEAKGKALEAWRKDKAGRMSKLVTEANVLRSGVKVLQEEITKAEEELRKLQESIAEKKSRKAVKEEELKVLTRRTPGEAYEAAVTRRDEINNKLEALKKSNEEKNRDSQRELDEILEKKSHFQRELNTIRNAKANNERINQRVAELYEEQKKLAQAVTDAEMVEAQISEYKKKYITAIEQSVSSLFELVRWKMYQPNLTNDGEKEICQAIIDGVPYEQQNRAKQMNAAVDIINGFSKGFGFVAPLFIDNKESVSDLIGTAGQVITLTVAAGEELNIH